MKKLISLCFAFLLLQLLTVAQIKTPDKRPFNIGVYSGVGGLNFSLIPGVDFNYNGTIIRVAPGYKAIGGGLIREIMPLSQVFYNWYWIASLYGGIVKEDDLYAANTTTTHYKGMLLTGVKVYFGQRWFSQVQGGVAYTNDKTPGRANDYQWTPYFEFSIGFQLFKTYPNLESAD